MKIYPMIRKHSLLLLGGFLLLCSACTKEPAGQPDLPATDEHKVSVEAALAELNALLPELDGATRTGRRTVANVALVNTSDLLPQTRSEVASDIKDLVYIANFENNQGYAILGADDRIPEILAVIEQENLSPEELIKTAHGNETTPSQAAGISQITDYLLAVGNGETGEATPAGGVVIIPPPDGYPTQTAWETVKNLPPLIPMKWDQGSPYNLYCPKIVNKKGEVVNGYVGCEAVAIGQILLLI